MIVFCHLLNDRSGSPQVLRRVIAAIGGEGDKACLYIGFGGKGVLEETDLPIRHYWYRRSSWRMITLFTYVISQLSLFTRLFRDRKINRNSIIYVNTLLPFGAALYGKLTGRPVVYHLHEVSVSPALLRWLLTKLARLTATQLIYVSEFHRRSLPINGVPAITLPNALDWDFMEHAQSRPYFARRNGVFKALMLASARDYKGVPEFLQLAARFAAEKSVRFDLVLNDEACDVARYLATFKVPSNVNVHPRSNRPAEFYENASVTLSLSRPDQCKETFGLTLIEAMAFGVPVIAPPVGGPSEIVENGVEGYLVDCREGELLYQTVLKMAENENLCVRLSEAARKKAASFSPDLFALRLQEVIKTVRRGSHSD